MPPLWLISALGWLRKAAGAVLGFVARYPWQAACVALLCASAWLWHGWNRTKADLKGLQDWRGQVVVAIKEASDNPDVSARNAVDQIRALGTSNRSLKTAITEQNARLDDMAARAIKLKAKAAQLQEIAAKARAQRQAALDKLSEMAVTPGTRDDCEQLLQEADHALDLVRSAGI